MNEKTLSAKLKRGTILIICFSMVFLLLCIVVLVSTRRSSREVVNDQMEQEVSVYKKQILRQLDMDRQFLQTTASLLVSSGMTDPVAAADSISSANAQNDFISIAFFNTDGIGIANTYGVKTEYNVDYRTLPDAAVEAIELSMTGQSAVSRLYYSTVSDQRVFTSTVPVIQNSQIIGVLAASSHVAIFQEILNNDPAGSGGGYIHLIGSEGNFLVRSPLALVQEDLESVFDGPFIEEDQKDEVLSALENQEPVFSSFIYKGQTCFYYLMPVEVNGWYLFYVSTQNDILAQKTSGILTVAFAVIAVLILAFLIYSVRLIRKSNQDLTYIATHDPLTHSINLRYFQEKFDHELHRDTPFCMAVINIHQFKFINEIFSNHYGDQMLCAIKEILDVQMKDSEFFCRGNADTFYLYLQEEEKSVIELRIRQIFREINRWSVSNQNTYQILMYAGAVLCNAQSDYSRKKSSDFFTHTLFALDKARSLPPDTIWFYDADLHQAEKLENYIESHMHQALEKKEFQLYLQPKFDLSSGCLGGAEALVRWQTSEGRTIYPDKFIPLFEQNGFCTELDMYMLEQVCQKIHSWISAGLSPVPVSVNQSKLLFYESNYTHRLADLIQKYEIPPNLITLEILEGLALENAEILDEKIKHIHSLGIQVSMDDFGSGYSSFHTLASLHIDELKLDRSFLLELSGEKHTRIRTIIRHILKMAADLSIRTVAEGVETKEDETLIKSLGCNLGQGYLYDKPMPADTFEESYIR